MTVAAFIEDNFDVDGLRELGFLTHEKTTEEIKDRICQWFGLDNIFLYDFIGQGKGVPVKADIKTFSDN